MEIEKKLKYMLDEIIDLNDFIEKTEEAMRRRKEIRLEVKKLLETYTNDLSRMR